MLPAVYVPQTPTTTSERSLEERVQAALAFLSTNLKKHGFWLVAGDVSGEGFLLLEGHGIVLDCALVSAASVVGINAGQSQRLSQATGTAMALRILVTKGGLRGTSEMTHVPLEEHPHLERDIVYNVLRTLGDYVGFDSASRLVDAATLQLQ